VISFPGWRLFGRATLDGGRDAPLDHRGLEVWHLALAGVALFGVVLLTLSFLSR
jgi:hypothetical protein